MRNITNNRPSTQWRKSAISYQNYQDYLVSKEDRFHLTLIDLLFISNFKGGNATINEPANEIEGKLKPYSAIIKKISKVFYHKKLRALSSNEVQKLIEFVDSLCELIKPNCKTKIDGFSASYLSALLSSFFPNLIPILDRRVLINSKLVSKEDWDSQQQIKKIHIFYPDLIEKFYKISLESGKSLREIDYEFFIINIHKN